jgi:hypothetical protein
MPRWLRWRQRFSEIHGLLSEVYWGGQFEGRFEDRDHAIALWTDGIAVEDDPGVEATLTLNGSSNRKAIGVDVQYGFEQQMMTDTEDENLIIHDLLVKDYPIMLRLTSTKNIFLPIVLKSYTH